MHVALHTLTSHVDRLDARVESLENRVDRLDSRVANLDNRAANLDSRVAKLNTSVKTLDARVGKLEIRAYDTKPIWEQVLKEIVDTRRDLSKRLDRIEAITYATRADRREAEDRIEKLESERNN